MNAALEIKTFKGRDAEKYLSDVARLRITVFRDYPYLYDGDEIYEKKYLKQYMSSPNAFFVLAFDADQVVGASTAIPLTESFDSFAAIFPSAGYKPDEVMYFGESVLLPQYRGHGLGKKFFDERLKYAKTFDVIKYAAFCAVIRDKNDPHRPKDHRPLDGLWQSFGFHPVPGLTSEISWKQIGESNETPKKMQFWLCRF